MQDFYSLSAYSYYFVGLISMTTAFIFKINQPNLPPVYIQSSTECKISLRPSYYLPGIEELGHAPVKTKQLLLIHFLMVFTNDIAVIYTTMWLSYGDGKLGVQNSQGIVYGSIGLIIFTVVDACGGVAKLFTKLNVGAIKSILNIIGLFQISIPFIIITAYLSFSRYQTLYFYSFLICLAIVNLIYRATLLEPEIQSNPVFQRCMEVTDRFEKLFVLCLMPGIVMLLLNRDDVEDCLLWISVAAIFLILLRTAMKFDKNQVKSDKDEATKVEKIQ